MLPVALCCRTMELRGARVGGRCTCRIHTTNVNLGRVRWEVLYGLVREVRRNKETVIGFSQTAKRKILLEKKKRAKWNIMLEKRQGKGSPVCQHQPGYLSANWNHWRSFILCRKRQGKEAKDSLSSGSDQEGRKGYSLLRLRQCSEESSLTLQLAAPRWIALLLKCLSPPFPYSFCC